MAGEEAQKIDWEEAFHTMGRDFSAEFAVHARTLHEQQPDLSVWQVVDTTRGRLNEEALLQLADMNARHFGPALPWEPGWRKPPKHS